MDYLKPVLRSAGKVARIYYSGACKEGHVYGALFPPIDVQAPLGNDTGFDAVRDIFRNEVDVSVAAGQDGIIRIVIGRVPVSILNTQIAVLSFVPSQQYSFNPALWRITDSNEVSAAERKLGVSASEPPVRTSLLMEPAEGLPHLPASMTNVTLDQALDVVATTFEGIIFYGTCTEPDRYVIYFEKLEPPQGFPRPMSKP